VEKEKNIKKSNNKKAKRKGGFSPAPQNTNYQLLTTRFHPRLLYLFGLSFRAALRLASLVGLPVTGCLKWNG